MITQKIIARTDSLKLDKIISRYGEDSMRQVVFIIVRPDPDSEELIPITIPEDAVGSFRILKPSGNFVIVPMSKSVLASGETAFDVVLPASANTAKGSGYYDIRITSDTDKYYFTAQGDFIIDDNIISDEVLEDVSEVNGLVFPDDFLTTEDHVAIIDDDSISTDTTWSSDKISEEIEAHAGGNVSKTVSGNPVTFEDGAAAPLVKCVTEIQGSQDLHGYDKPWVGGAGKNKWSLGDITTDTLGVAFSCPAGTYTLSATPSNPGTTVTAVRFFYADDTSVLATLSTSTNYTATLTFASDVVKVNISTTNGSETEVQLELGSAKTSFEPYSNICPITAYTEGKIVERGKNLFDKTTYTFTSEKYVSLSTGNIGTNSSYACTESYIPCGNLAGQTITLNHIPGGAQPGMAFYDSNNDYISGGKGEAISVPSNAVSYRFTVPIGYASGNDVQIELGSTPTTYEPYTSTTHTTTYPSAIYRGSEDVVNGEVTTEWGMIASYAGETLPGEWISDRDEYAPGTTPTTGAQVAYELATPTTSSVTPTNLPIKSLNGYTHIESTTGDMEVEYITQRYQPLIDSIKQL